jgi:hypothetical protein
LPKVRLVEVSDTLVVDFDVLGADISIEEGEIVNVTNSDIFTKHASIALHDGDLAFFRLELEISGAVVMVVLKSDTIEQGDKTIRRGSGVVNVGQGAPGLSGRDSISLEKDVGEVDRGELVIEDLIGIIESIVIFVVQMGLVI